MAEKLVKYFELANQHGGLPIKMRLAMKTAVSAQQAVQLPDSPELLERFYQAAREILGANAKRF
jgi:hypothetical protein